MSQIRISACSANYGHLDLGQVMDCLAAHGFDGIEITAMYHAPPADTGKERRLQIVRQAQDAGLQISALHFVFAPGLSMTSDDLTSRAKVVDHLVSVLELAADIHAPVVVIGGGGVRSVPKGMEPAEGRKRVSGILAETMQRVDGNGVVAGLEALNRYETNLGRTLAECYSIVEAVGDPQLKVVGDTFHMNIEETSLSNAIDDAGKKLAHLHLPDSHRLAPGGGHIEFASIFEALRRIDYQEFVSFEFFSISPELWHLPSFEACDAEVASGIHYLKERHFL